MRSARFPRLAAAAVAAVITLPCAAQYAWTDQHGVHHYSDQPPPPSVPANRILDPSGSTTPGANEAPVSHEAPAPKGAPSAPTLAERNAEFLKRRAEQQTQDKKAKEKAERDRENAKNCERARNYRATLASGQRMVNTDNNGQRSFMTDQQRAEELREVDQILQKCH